MTRIYRAMWEESAFLPSEDYKSHTEKKHFGKITVHYGENTRTGKTFFTVTSGAELFDDEEQKSRLETEIVSALGTLMKKYSLTPESKIMVVGLGNEKITADSLGCRVADKLTVTSHMYSDEGVRSRYGNLCAFKSSVSGVTGIESFDLITSAAKTVKPDLIVAVDTLSCGKSERLGCTVQLTDNGIEPGGGVNNPKRKLSSDSLKTPVIAIGVPFVIYVKTLLSEYGVSSASDQLSSLVVTAKEIDFLIEDFSDVIAIAINSVVHGKHFPLFSSFS